MSIQPFLVASEEVGLEKDMEPWLLPETAYPQLEDAYGWRKRVKRRIGNRFLGRLTEETIQTYPLAVTGAAIAWAGTVDFVPIRPYSILITINAYIFADDGIGNIISTTPGCSGTVNYLTGAITLAFPAIGGGPYNVDVVYNFYPNLPAMGLCTKENFAINAEDLIGFNTTKSNIWNPATAYFDDISFYDHSDQPISWTGTDYNFFDSENYQGAFFATNNTPGFHTQNIVSTAKGATTTFTFTNNILDVGDTVFIKNLVPVAPDTDVTLKNLNDHSFPITAATATTITIAYNSAGFANNPTGGIAFMPQHSSYTNAQTITGVAVGATTTITFAVNNINIGTRVYIKWIAVGSTVRTVLNDKSFIVANAVLGAGGSITLDVDSTGLNWAAGGLVVVPIGDGIRWYSNDATVNGWVNFNPPLNDATALKGGRIMLGYKDRLVVLSTFEGDIGSGAVINYTNRARWSQDATCFYTDPSPLNQSADGLAWRDDIPGYGGYIDAPVSEAIISAEFIRDTLVVFFERTTWALRFTDNPAVPFVWVRINIEFGSAAQFSAIAFDKGVLAVGNRGIITSDGNNVARIDLKIPYEVFDASIGNNNGARIHGVRDYYNELVYWTYVNRNDASNGGGVTIPNGVSYPNKMFVYNYRENSFAIFNDSYTCFGYFTAGKAFLWNTANVNWNNAQFNWNSPQGTTNFPDIVAGTNTGYIMILNKDDGNGTQIAVDNVTIGVKTLITTKGNHNLLDGQYVSFSGFINGAPPGMVNMNGKNTQISLTDPLVAIPTTQFVCMDIDSTLYGAYIPNTGEITRLNNFSILTKQFNPFVSQGKSVYMNKAFLYTDYIDEGRISVYVYTDNYTAPQNPINVAQPGGTQFWQIEFPLDQSTNSLTPISKTWTSFFCHARGQFVQLQLTLNKTQMLDSTTNTAPFVLHGMIMHMGSTGRLISR